jgi:uncharacterized membrane protein YgdD (TMEM256/DUF423 family)
MQWIRSIAREIWGLFVDDGSFAAGTLVWLGIVMLVLRRVAWIQPFGGVVLFVGLSALLIANVLRYARKGRK